MYGVIIKGERVIIRSELANVQFEALKQLSKVTFIANYYSTTINNPKGNTNILADVKKKYSSHIIITVPWKLFFEICTTGELPFNQESIINYEESKRLDS